MKDIQKNLLYIISIPFLLGVTIQSFIQLGLITNVWLFLIASICVIWSWYTKVHSTQTLFCIAVTMCFIGMCLFSYTTFRLESSPLHQFENKQVTINAVVISLPVELAYSQKFLVSSESIGSTTIKEKILIYSLQRSNFKLGDTVQINGTLTKPTNFINEIGKEVDYRALLAKDGIQYEIKKANVEVISTHKTQNIIFYLKDAKDILVSSLKKSLPEPDASLAVGMLLGEKESLGDRLTTQLRDTGLIHIVVLSGYNIAIIILLLQGVGSVFPKRTAYIFTIVGISLFVLTVGGGSTIVRASIMGFLAVSTQVVGRSYNAGRALWIAAFVMVCINPFILVYDMSFQLSFLATVGIIYISPIIEFVWKSKKFIFIKTVVVTTLSTQIIVMPYLLYSTGMISTIGLLTNILVVPLVPFVMAISFVVSIVGIIHPLLVLPFSFLSNVMFDYIKFIIEYFSLLKFSSIKLVIFPWWGMVTVYSFLLVIIVYFYKRIYINTNKI